MSASVSRSWSYDVVQRVASRLDRSGPLPSLHPDLGPCWLWPGSRTTRGYGMVQVGGTRKRPLRAYVHRVMWTSENGPIPEGHEVHHRCEVTACGRPSHLEAVTHRGNMLATPHNAAARHAAQVACSRCGGPLDRTDKRGRRECRRCRNQRAAEYRARQRAKGLRWNGRAGRWVA